jgi:hypothetical protein
MARNAGTLCPATGQGCIERKECSLGKQGDVWTERTEKPRPFQADNSDFRGNGTAVTLRHGSGRAGSVYSSGFFCEAERMFLTLFLVSKVTAHQEQIIGFPLFAPHVLDVEGLKLSSPEVR